mgnify:FL=1|tara:strand:- start:1927 stop:2802 length:876 start_codon:yes stop_codon:yes gene_type:complete
MKNTIKIGNKIIGDKYPTFVIAEIGINHNGDLKIAKELIEQSKNAGADAVKFQKRDLNLVFSKEELDKPRKTPFGETNRDLKEALEFDEKEYKEIDLYCKEIGIMWSASAWDLNSLDFLMKFDVPFIKIASAMLTDKDLLIAHAKTNKPLIISSGMSTETQIDKAVELLNPNMLALLHCTSTYPAKTKQLNLSYIKNLMNKYNFPIGYSGHEVGLSTTICAVALGAKVIERHVTLDRSMWGSDQSASVEMQGFSKLIRDIRNFEEAYGDGKKVVYDDELPILQKLRKKNTL